MRGEVVLPSRTPEPVRIAMAEVQFIPEAAMASFVAARSAEARARIEALEAAQEGLRAEVERLHREKDRTERLWRATMESDLYRKLQLQLRPPSSVQEMRAIQRSNLREKRASHETALAAARRANEKEGELAALRREAARYRDGAFFAEGLPPAVQVARADEAGRFAAALPPGKYAAVARAEAQGPVPGPTLRWMVWTRLEPGRDTVLRLGPENLHGSDCPACVVPVRTLGGEGATRRP
jgi:hypothetical protein